MQHDPELVAETCGWLARAERDLVGGRVDLVAEPALTGDAVFHAQQAAEKAVKGFLTWHRQPFRKTHNLTEARSNSVLGWTRGWNPSSDGDRA